MAKTQNHKTGFYTDERTFWHSTGMQALFFPAGGWVQPPISSPGADTPESKRRFLNLVHYSGLSAKLDMRGSAPVTMEDLLRVHTKDYITRFKAVSDAGGGELGAPPRAFKADSRLHRYPRGSRKLPWRTFSPASCRMRTPCVVRPDITVLRIRPWASVCSRTFRSRSKRRERSTVRCV
jgi:hypothetical protein